MKVFLGGTCASTNWRDLIIPMLEDLNIDYFNPVVDDWNESCQAIEEDEKWNKCDVHLYVITPQQQGYFSFVEIIDSAASFGGEIMFAYAEVVDGETFTKAQLKSLQAIESVLDKRYTHVLHKGFKQLPLLLEDDW